MKNITLIEDLPFTGERFTADAPLLNTQIYHEHLHRYLFAAQCVRGLAVLDIACGEGYGSALLAASAASVVGVDVSAETIAHAERKYRLANLRFLAGECRSIPVKAQSIDVVVSFETIEHLEEHEVFMRDIRRVLKPGGLLIISSPDREKYEGRGAEKNPFHKKELSHPEFADLMRQHFQHVALLEQKLVAGSSLEVSADSEPENSTTRGHFRGGLGGGEFVPGTARGLYVLAVCSDAGLPALPVGSFENPDVAAQIWDSFEILPALRTSYAEAQQKIAELEAKGADGIKTGAIPAELEMQLRSQIVQLNEEVEQRGRWGRSLSAEIETLRGLARKDEVDRLDLRGRLIEMELNVARQREASEASEVAVVLVRGENERKHAAIIDLAKRLSAAESEVARLLTAEQEEKARLAGELQQLGVRLADQRGRYEDQLLAAQEQFAASLKENQALMARLNSVESEVTWNRAQLERWQQSDHTLRQMQLSWSWRVTAPLRKFHQWLGDPLYRRRR